MQKISKTHFRVADLKGLSAFYGDLLGMEIVAEDDQSISFFFDRNENSLVFHKAPVSDYSYGQQDFYWKIGLTLKDLDVAVEYLRSRGLELPDPYQFRDIGYMSKITDPMGFQIELLQQGFEGSHEAITSGAHPIGGQATLAHITLRVSDLSAARDSFEGDLGMRLMSVQPIRDRGFCLYFYAWNDEPLPYPDLEAVVNREWLWRRPYSLIELQHWEDPATLLHKTPLDLAGFDGFSYGEGAAETACKVGIQSLEKLI